MQREYAKLYCEKWRALTAFLVGRTAHFSLLDWAIFKTCLITLGLMISTWFARLFKKLAPLVALVFIVSWIYMIWRIFMGEDID